MSKGVSTSTDKNIVDKSRSHRNTAVSKAVRTTRERLQAGPSNASGFDKELLGLHVDTMLQGAIAMPLFIILVTIIGVYLSQQLDLVVWGVTARCVNAIGILLARRAKARDIPTDKVSYWRCRFLFVQIVLGVCWAAFILQDCDTCGEVNFGFYKAAVLLIALAATAMGTFLLRNALLFTFVPVVVALSTLTLKTGNPGYLALTIIMSTSLIFLVFMTNRMHRGNVHILSVQAEKDDLIAELEVAKSIRTKPAAAPRKPTWQSPASSRLCRMNCAPR